MFTCFCFLWMGIIVSHFYYFWMSCLISILQLTCIVFFFFFFFFFFSAYVLHCTTIHLFIICYKNWLIVFLIKTYLQFCSIMAFDFSRDTAFPTGLHVRQAKKQISLRIRAVWSGSLLSTWRTYRSMGSHRVSCNDSDQTSWMRRLICVFLGAHATLSQMLCPGPFVHTTTQATPYVIPLSLPVK